MKFATIKPNELAIVKNDDTVIAIGELIAVAKARCPAGRRCSI